MIKQEQDEIWNSIPVRFRDKIRNDYSVISKGEGIYDMGQTKILEEYFGKHNITSVFNVGDRVRIKGQTVVREIKGITKNGNYVLNGKGSTYDVNELVLYTGICVGDKVKVKKYPNCICKVVETYVCGFPNWYRVSVFDGDAPWEEEFYEDEIIKM